MNKENHPDAIAYRIDPLNIGFFGFYDVIDYCMSKGYKLNTIFTNITTIELPEDEATFMMLKFPIKLTRVDKEQHDSSNAPIPNVI